MGWAQRSIHAVRSRIVNAYIVETGGGLILIDTGFRSAAPQILKHVQALGYSPRDVRLIFLTHAHIDHIGSAAELARWTGAPLAMHRADAAKARAGKHNLPSGRGAAGKLLERTFNRLQLQFRYEPVEPDILLGEGDSLRDFGADLRVIETPGHSLGSLSLAGDEGVMFIGDAVINQIRVGMPLYGEDTALAYDSARKILGLRPRVLYSGHGKPFSGADLARYFEIKHLSVERVQA